MLWVRVSDTRERLGASVLGTQHCVTEWVFALGDAQSFSGLTSKIPPLGSMLNFDADVKNTTARYQCENGLEHLHCFFSPTNHGLQTTRNNNLFSAKHEMTFDPTLIEVPRISFTRINLGGSRAGGPGMEWVPIPAGSSDPAPLSQALERKPCCGEGAKRGPTL